MKESKNKFLAWLSCKCPKCRTGKMFVNKGIFPLKDFLKMKETCDCCGQKMEPEPGFYYGTGYVNYAITFILLAFNALWFAIFIGFSWANNSLYWYLGISLVMWILLQPWLKRIARAIYLSMHVPYDPAHPIHGTVVKEKKKKLSKEAQPVPPTGK